MEGRQLYMILAPNAKVAQRARELARQHLAAIASKKQQAHAHPKNPPAPKPAQEPGTDQQPRAAAPASSGTE
jgi:translation initiation factor IF-3